jgi:hypothetical protein
MTPMRLRILVLEFFLSIVLALAGWYALSQASFGHANVHDQLAAQRISFAPASAISAKEYPPSALAALKKYAGQPVDTGEKARVYADDYIAIHLKAIGHGQTYSQVSAAALKSPQNAQLQAERNTIFMGTMLRGSLLNVWGWSILADNAQLAGMLLVVGAILVFLAFLYELLIAPRRAGTALST